MQIETKTRKNQKVKRNDGNEMVVTAYPKTKKKKILDKTNLYLPFCPRCKRSLWIELDCGYYCAKVNSMLKNQSIL